MSDAAWTKQLEPPQLSEKIEIYDKPNLFTLVKIGIAEKNVDDVNKWYRMIQKGKYYDERFYDTIAQTIQEKRAFT